MLWCGRRLVGQRNEPATVLACAFRQKLLQPRTKIGDSRRGYDRHLVAAEARCRNAERDAELYTRILRKAARRSRRRVPSAAPSQEAA